MRQPPGVLRGAPCAPRVDAQRAIRNAATISIYAASAIDQGDSDDARLSPDRFTDDSSSFPRRHLLFFFA
jgi:hypothetical protein